MIAEINGKFVSAIHKLALMLQDPNTMDDSTLKYLSLIIPGIIAVVGNMIFYMLIKKRIDNSIENYKISYSGVFKEKIEIHKELLKQIYGLKLKIQQYQYSGDKTIGNEVFHDFGKFINHYLVNQPFIKQNIYDSLIAITKELQACFDDFYRHNSMSGVMGIEPEIRTDLLNKFFESGNKFKTNEPFKQLEDLIIAEMKKDLRIADD